ncbi:MAG: TfoX/Sxy family protein [Pseudomonadota bacterium]
MGNELVDHCLELLAPLGAVRARRMFGGHGLYCDDLFFGLIARERLYLKVDTHSQAGFADAGCEPFVYDAKGRRSTMGYWSVPAEAMESPTLMQPWARQALAAALRARAAKPSAAPRKARAARAQAQAGTSRRRP